MKKLGFGLMRLPQLDPANPRSIDIEQVKQMADTYISRGFTYFDTAYMYHDGYSERAFRQAVAERYPRTAFTITDKLPMMMIKNKEDLPRIFDEQLERTGVDYFDYYWLHNLNVNSIKTVNETDAFDFILRKKQEGLVRHIGFSFHDSAALLEQILTDHPETEFVQLQINYLDWSDAGIQSGDCYNVATAHQKPVIVMEPLKGGSLVRLPDEAAAILKKARPDLSIASWGIRFAASLPNVLTVLSGMSSIDQLNDNTTYMQELEPLTDEEKQILANVTDIIRARTAVPCTACRYCVDQCPQQIPIPSYFALYNAWDNWQRDGAKGFNSQKMYYSHFINGGATPASACIVCRQCEQACPQHIHIPDILPQVAAAFE